MQYLEALRRIHTRAVQRGPLHEVDEDLQREAGMDGNYQQLLQAARDLDTPEQPAPRPPCSVCGFCNWNHPHMPVPPMAGCPVCLRNNLEWTELDRYDFPGSRVVYATIGDIAIDVHLPGDTDRPKGAVILRLLSREGDAAEPRVTLENFPLEATEQTMQRAGLDNLDVLCRIAGIVNPLG